MTEHELGHGHYLLAADRRAIGSCDYDLRCIMRTSLGERYAVLPPPTPLWHWAVW